jgi:hypothetical protein
MIDSCSAFASIGFLLDLGWIDGGALFSLSLVLEYDFICDRLE